LGRLKSTILDQYLTTPGISEMVEDSDIATMEGNKNSCAVYRMALFSVTV